MGNVRVRGMLSVLFLKSVMDVSFLKNSFQIIYFVVADGVEIKISPVL